MLFYSNASNLRYLQLIVCSECKSALGVIKGMNASFTFESREPRSFSFLHTPVKRLEGKIKFPSDILHNLGMKVLVVRLIILNKRKLALLMFIHKAKAFLFVKVDALFEKLNVKLSG